MNEAEYLRVAEILGMFHAHDPGLCGEFGRLPGCKLLSVIFELIRSGGSAGDWWLDTFSNDFVAWEDWLREHGVVL